MPAPERWRSTAIHLGIDYGTTNTVAVLHHQAGPGQLLLFDGSPQLPSAVFADPVAGLRTGRDAHHHATLDPCRLEPNPKQRIDEPAVLLADTAVPVVDLMAATLHRVRDEAERVSGAPPTSVTVTHPVGWGPQRRARLLAAATRAGLPHVALVAEPVAAAAYFIDVLATAVPPGHAVVVYDFGAGTFDASAVRRDADGLTVLASQGLADTGGLDIDAAVVELLLAAHPDASWRTRIEQPATTEDRRLRTQLWHDARTAKELLSRATTTLVHLPGTDTDIPLGRDQLDACMRPLLERTVAATLRTVAAARAHAAEVGGVFLVGGSSRIPLVATLLHRATGIAPTILDQPELVVAEGAAHLGVATPPNHRAPTAPPPAGLRPPAPTARHPASHPAHRTGRAVVLTLLLTAAATTTWLIGHRTDQPDHPGGRASTTVPASTTERPGPQAPTSAITATTSHASTRQATADTTASGYPASLAGTWEGMLHQSNGARWQMRLQVTATAPTAIVTYPTAGCGGVLTLIAVDATSIRVREQITTGNPHCTQQGSATLTPAADGTLHVTYQPDGADYTADAVLSRATS